MLFESYNLGGTTLANRTVMAPMTRSRTTNRSAPDALVAEYYKQRATAGLIVTEGTSPSPNGVGYARIPGLYNAEQVRGWRLTTDAVHKAGGKIFVQLMHTGRVSHQDNLPAGARVVGPSPDVCPGEMWTDKAGQQPHTAPVAMTESDIATVIQEYAAAAKLAIQAGFDGIELHAANGYLMEQFLNANINKRTDGYGGSAEARNRFVLEIAKACATAIGADKVGIRISPYGVFMALGHSTEWKSSSSHWQPSSPIWVWSTCTWSTIPRWVHRPFRATSRRSFAPLLRGLLSQLVGLIFKVPKMPCRPMTQI